MAHSRNSWFSNWFAPSNISDAESHHPLLIDEESEDDEIIIDLSHQKNINDSHYSALRAAISSSENQLSASSYRSDDLEYIDHIEVSEESGDEADLSSEIKNDDTDYFLLKIELLRRLLDECLVSLQSEERKAKFKKKYVPLACGVSCMTAGVLILLTGILVSAITATRYNKIAHVFGEAYKATPIPNNTGISYACDSLDITLKARDLRKLDMGDPRGACSALRESKKFPEFSPRTEFSGPDYLAKDASSICLTALSELCKEFNKTLYSNNKYTALVIQAPLYLTLLASILICNGFCFIPKSIAPTTLKNLAINREEKKRIKKILTAFEIDLTNKGQPVDELRAEIETLKEDLNKIERRYFTEKNIIPQKIQGQHFFFSQLLDMVCPEKIYANKAEFEKTWVTAKKKGLFE